VSTGRKSPMFLPMLFLQVNGVGTLLTSTVPFADPISSTFGLMSDANDRGSGKKDLIFGTGQPNVSVLFLLVVVRHLDVMLAVKESRPSSGSEPDIVSFWVPLADVTCQIVSMMLLGRGRASPAVGAPTRKSAARPVRAARVARVIDHLRDPVSCCDRPD